MSKITQALEKAARERRHRLQEQVSVSAKPVALPLDGPTRIGEVESVTHLHVDPHIVAATEPDSPIAEQYRILRTNFQSLRLRPGAKVIVVTSAIHGEGKSVTATNLALTLARQAHLKILLVDGDLRKGTIHKWLGLPSRKDGLSSALNRDGELNGSLVRLQTPPLSILQAGPHPKQPAELLESITMRRLLATLKTQFDVVIIDAPPILPVADPGIIAAQADGVLLVVRAGKTQRKTVEQAQRLLKQMKTNVIGCVLTHVDYYLPKYYRYFHQYHYRYAERDLATGGSAAPSMQVVTSSSEPPTPRLEPPAIGGGVLARDVAPHVSRDDDAEPGACPGGSTSPPPSEPTPVASPT